jgi:hypothetical protein
MLSSVSAVAPVPGRAGAGESVEELCQGTAQSANRPQHYSGWLKTRGATQGRAGTNFAYTTEHRQQSYTAYTRTH